MSDRSQGSTGALLTGWRPVWVVCTVVFVRWLSVISGDDAFLVQYIADDGFYYLELAQNWQNLGRWSFDEVEPSSGFHLAFAYLLAVIAFLQGDEYSWRTSVLVITGMGAAAMCGAAAVLYSAIKTCFGPQMAIATLALFLSPIVLWQPTMVVESPLTIFLAAALVLVVLKQPKKHSLVVLTTAFFVGFLGPITRSDFGLWLAALFSGTCAARFIGARLSPWTTGVALGGSILGTALVLLHTRWISGGAMQSSAEMKLYWSSVRGHSPEPIIDLWQSMIVPAIAQFDDPLKFVIMLTGLMFLIFILRVAFKNRKAGPPRLDAPKDAMALSIASVIALTGYAYIYSFNSAAIQPWYVANIFVPSAILMGAGLTWLARTAPRLPLAAFFVYLVFAPISILPIWRHQSGMYYAALALQSYPNDVVIGSWNAGILRHISDADVVNLDGLVNDTIYPFVTSGHLMNYINSREIKYLVDFSAMLTSPPLVGRSGLSDDEVVDCIFEQGVLASHAPTWMQSKMTIFEVSENCPARND